MNDTLEPRSERVRDIRSLVGVLGATTDAKSAIYVSAPITTGRRFAEWHPTAVRVAEADDPEYRRGHSEHVIEPNRAQARALVDSLRRSLRQVVIDPTSVPDLEGWNQDDYRALWASVIERYAERVVFVNDWEHSSGCAYEFLVACRLGLPMATESGASLTNQSGFVLLHSAIADLRARGIDVAFLSWVLSEAEAVANRRPRLARG